MKFLFAILLTLSLFLIITSCQKEEPKKEDVPVTYNFSNYTFIGNTNAIFDTTLNNVNSSWDTLYADSVLVKIDSTKDKIVFIANINDPLNVYTQTEFDFEISSNYFRKTFIQNHYQSFFFEGDTLKSYFFRLQQGVGVSYQKIIQFSGYLKPL